jgi:HAD superfamily hydrolase (TIGR01549 family)
MSRRAFDSVLFDCGGTLVEQIPSPVEVFCRVAGEVLGRSVDQTAVSRAYERVEFAHRQSAVQLARPGGDKRLFHDAHNRLLCLALGMETHHARLSPALQEAFRRDPKWRAFPDAAATLEVLAAAGVSLHVVANWDTNLPDVLASAGLHDRFATILASAGLGIEKPDPRIFDRVLATLPVPPSRCLYVGDDYALDAIAARGAGLVPVIVDRARRYPDADCCTVASLSEVPALLAS